MHQSTPSEFVLGGSGPGRRTRPRLAAALHQRKASGSPHIRPLRARVRLLSHPRSFAHASYVSPIFWASDLSRSRVACW